MSAGESKARRVIADCHSHTYLCYHAEMVRPRLFHAVANAMNFKYYAFCCHNPFLDNSVTPEYRMRFYEFGTFMELYEQEKNNAAAVYPDLTLLLGMEVDWHPEDPAKTRAFVELCDNFDYLLGSLHYYEARYEGVKDTTQFVINYYDYWEAAFSSGYFYIMSHMDFYKAILGATWFQVYKDNEAILQRAEQALKHLCEFNERREAYGLFPIAIEVNTGSSQYDGMDMTLPSENIIRIAVKLGLPISLGSDAHFSSEVGRNMRDVLELLGRCGAKRLCFFIRREIQYYSLDDAIETLNSLNLSQLYQLLKRTKQSQNCSIE